MTIKYPKELWFFNWKTLSIESMKEVPESHRGYQKGYYENPEEDMSAIETVPTDIKWIGQPYTLEEEFFCTKEDAWEALGVYLRNKAKWIRKDLDHINDLIGKYYERQ